MDEDEIKRLRAIQQTKANAIRERLHNILQDEQQGVLICLVYDLMQDMFNQCPDEARMWLIKQFADLMLRYDPEFTEESPPSSTH